MAVFFIPLSKARFVVVSLMDRHSASVRSGGTFACGICYCHRKRLRRYQHLSRRM